MHILWRSLLLVLIGLGLSACSHVSYLAQNTWQHLSLFTGQKEIEQVLQDNSVPAETKRSLNLVLKVRQMAFNEFGFKKSKNYSTFVQTPEAYVSYAVEAAPEFSLSPVTWYFPIIGSVPYLGYYRKQNALNKFNELQDQGYDVAVRGISAFSTLGWFTDPVFSSMLGDDSYLIQTVFHELTHATIYFKNYSEFNENLASFVGKQCALKFMAQEWGEKSVPYQKLLFSEQDFAVVIKQIQAAIPTLEALYQNDDFNPEEKRLHKNKILEDLVVKIQNLAPKIHPENKHLLKNLSKKMNNAHLMNYRLYFGKSTQFDRMFEGFKGDMRQFLAFWSKVDEGADPQKILTEWSIKP